MYTFTYRNANSNRFSSETTDLTIIILKLARNVFPCFSGEGICNVDRWMAYR